MKAILAIARAEILKNWKIIAVPLSAVVGVFVLAALGTKVSDQDFQGSLMGIFVLFTFPLAAVPAAVLGLNLFGPDIRQRRLSFFLTRPCAPWQLWLGRLTGAFAIVGIGWLGVAATLPFSGFGATGGGLFRVVGTLIFAALLAGMLLVMNAIAMILAANSARWFIADVAAVIVFLGGAAWSAERTLALGDLSLIENGFFAITLGGLVALFFGGLAFLAAGHGEGPSGHRAHSLAIWSFAAVVLAGLGAQRAYEWNRPLGSMLSYPSATSVGPTEALVSTYGRRKNASFLLDTRSGQARRVSAFMGYSSAPTRSGLVGFIEPRFDPASTEHGGPLTRDVGVREGFLSDHLVISPLDPSRLPIADRPVPSRFRALTDISPNLNLAIFLTSGGLTVIRTQTGATEFDLTGANMRWARFQSESTIVALDSDGSAARLRVLGLDGKVIEQRRFPVSEANWFATLHSDSGRVAVTQPRIGVVLYERDGRTAASLPPSPQSGTNFRGAASASPQAVLITRAGDLLFSGGQGLRVVLHDEAVVREVPLVLESPVTFLGGELRISGELESGEIVISQFERGEYSILIVEPRTGEVHVRLNGFRPLVFRWNHQMVGLESPSEDSALRLFRNEDRDIVYLDPGSKTPRLLVKNTSEDR